MEQQFVCPLCHSTNGCENVQTSEVDYEHFHCATYKRFFALHYSILESEEYEKIMNLIAEFLLQNEFWRMNGMKYKYHFYYSETSKTMTPQFINMADRINQYPEEFMEMVLRALVNLSTLYPEYGQSIHRPHSWHRVLFETLETAHNSDGVCKLLSELGYMSETWQVDHSRVLFYTISAEGWKKIEEIRNRERAVKQGFIAMRFGEETKSIREAFRTAIKDCGYDVSIIDEKEHNNQIVPEIFYEIERSKFVVVYVTVPNYGAYYEAGYVQALGKQVIMCCRKSEFDSDKGRPHFDVAQKSMIVWKDEEELVERLRKRIEATVK